MLFQDESNELQSYKDNFRNLSKLPITYLLLLLERSSFSWNHWSTQSCSSVQSGWRPQVHPVEWRLKSQTLLLFVKHSHFLTPGVHWQGGITSRLWTRCRPKVAPPVFWMCKYTRTSSCSISICIDLSSTVLLKLWWNIIPCWDPSCKEPKPKQDDEENEQV